MNLKQFSIHQGRLHEVKSSENFPSFTLQFFISRFSKSSFFNFSNLQFFGWFRLPSSVQPEILVGVLPDERFEDCNMALGQGLNRVVRFDFYLLGQHCKAARAGTDSSADNHGRPVFQGQLCRTGHGGRSFAEKINKDRHPRCSTLVSHHADCLVVPQGPHQELHGLLCAGNLHAHGISSLRDKTVYVRVRLLHRSNGKGFC